MMKTGKAIKHSAFKHSAFKRGRAILAALLITFSWSMIAIGQQEQTRGLRIKKLEEGRPAATTPDASSQPRTYRSTNTTVSSSDIRKSGSATEEILGVTLWRLRPAQSADNKDARLLEQKAGKSAEWTAERVEADTPIGEGDRVRISIESPTSGYLYVIDREMYADGTRSDPTVIFPTRTTRGGNNAVVAGRVIEFPAQEDSPPYFTLSRSRKEHVGEELSFIVTQQPLAEVPANSASIKLPADLLAEWEKRWGGAAERFELEGGAGRQYTKEEKAAGTDGSRMLTQADPLPQTILRVNTKPGNALFVKLVLRIAQ